MKCQKAPCERQAVHAVQLRFFGSMNTREPGLPMIMRLVLCGECRFELDPVISDNKSALVQLARANMRIVTGNPMAPVILARTRVEYIPIAEMESYFAKATAASKADATKKQ